MPHNQSSDDVAWILKQIGITLKRHGKEDVYSGEYQGKNRVVIVPRNKKEHSERHAEFDLATGRNYE